MGPDHFGTQPPVRGGAKAREAAHVTQKVWPRATPRRSAIIGAETSLDKFGTICKKVLHLLRQENAEASNPARRSDLLATFGSGHQRNHAGQRHSVEQNTERRRNGLAVRSPVGREKAGRHQRINLGLADLDGDAPQPQPLPLARFPHALCRR